MADPDASLEPIASGAAALRIAAALTQAELSAEDANQPAALQALVQVALSELDEYLADLREPGEEFPKDLAQLQARFPNAKELVEYVSRLHDRAGDSQRHAYFRLFTGAHLVLERHAPFSRDQLIQKFRGLPGVDHVRDMLADAIRGGTGYDLGRVHQHLAEIARHLSRERGQAVQRHAAVEQGQAEAVRPDDVAPAPAAPARSPATGVTAEPAAPPIRGKEPRAASSPRQPAVSAAHAVPAPVGSPGSGAAAMPRVAASPPVAIATRVASPPRAQGPAAPTPSPPRAEAPAPAVPQSAAHADVTAVPVPPMLAPSGGDRPHASPWPDSSSEAARPASFEFPPPVPERAPTAAPPLQALSAEAHLSPAQRIEGPRAVPSMSQGAAPTGELSPRSAPSALGYIVALVSAAVIATVLYLAARGLDPTLARFAPVVAGAAFLLVAIVGIVLARVRAAGRK